MHMLNIIEHDVFLQMFFWGATSLQ